MTKDERVRFTFRVSKKMLDTLKKQADELGVSTNSLMIQILWDYIEKKQDVRKFK